MADEPVAAETDAVVEQPRVSGYPRWQGELSTGPAFLVIAAKEIRRGVMNQWSQSALILSIAFAVLYINSVHTAGATAHTMDNFLSLVNTLRWAALGVAAVMAGPALLEDARKGGLELYLSRAVTTWDYLTGKILGVLTLSTASVLVPALLYWIASFALFEKQPDNWNLVPLQVLVYALTWAVVVTGLGLGLSCVSRSSRAATLILFGGMVLVDKLIAALLEGITRDGKVQVLSPFSAHHQQIQWLFNVKPPFAFDVWWGIVYLVVLLIVGWGLVIWKHPRIKGVEA